MRLIVYINGSLENEQDRNDLAESLLSISASISQGFTCDPEGVVSFFVEDDEEEVQEGEDDGEERDSD